MIKSTKLERAAIEARLRDALAIKGNSDIESTLNVILDYNNIEELFLKIHKKYENLFISEYKFADKYNGFGGKYLENEQQEFIKSFNELAELFSNVVEVARQKRETDRIIDEESNGAASIVRGGKNHGVHVKTSFGVSKQYSSVSINPQLAQQYVRSVQPNTQSIINNAYKKGHVNTVLSTNCAQCGGALTIADKNSGICNSCFYTPLVYVCCDCTQTFTPSDINQKSCSECQSARLCNHCNLPFKKAHVYSVLCDSCSLALTSHKKKTNSLISYALSLFNKK